MNQRKQLIRYLAQRYGKPEGSHNWNRHRFSVADLDAETLNCPSCSTKWEQSAWKPCNGFDEPGSPSWEYGCPTDSCNTLFVFERNYD